MRANYLRGWSGVVVALAGCVLGQRSGAAMPARRPAATRNPASRPISTGRTLGSAGRLAPEERRPVGMRAHVAEAGSFLRRPAPSVQEFVARVQGDPVLQQRYGRHLGVPWRQVAGYLAARLQPGTIPKAGHYTVYHVTSDGLIYPTKQRLARGTRVYRIRASRLFFTVYGDPGRPFFVPTVGAREPARRVRPPQPQERLEIIHVPSD